MLRASSKKVSQQDVSKRAGAKLSGEFTIFNSKNNSLKEDGLEKSVLTGENKKEYTMSRDY